MSKPYVLICYDTEDPMNPEADDALGELARLYHDAGVLACFFMVGEKTRMLRERGRRDVLDALRGHEINYHGNYWFEYPEPALVYGNSNAWDTAVQKALAYETRGLRDVAEITGQFPVAFTQHQNNHSPATTHALQQAGVKVWNWSVNAPTHGVSWVMDMLVVGKSGGNVSSQGSWGGFQHDPEEAELQPPPMDAATELKEFQAAFDKQLERGDTHITISGHPTCWALAEWWGWYEWPLPFRGAGQNGAAGPYPHGRLWERGGLRAAADSEAHYAWTREAAKWLAGRQDIRMGTFGDVLAAHEEKAGRWLTRDEIYRLAEHVQSQAAQGEFNYVSLGDVTLSAADALWVLASYIEFLLSQHRRPDAIQIRRTLGPVEEVLVPQAPLAFHRSSLLLAARQTVHYVNAHGRIPHALRAHYVDCGPGELLLALASAITPGKLPLEVIVAPTSGVPQCAEMDCFAAASANSTNAPPGYEPTQIHSQLRQQSWSYRPALRR